MKSGNRLRIFELLSPHTSNCGQMTYVRLCVIRHHLFQAHSAQSCDLQHCGHWLLAVNHFTHHQLASTTL